MDSKLTEMSCGWSELPVADLNNSQTHTLEIKGGSPMALTDIKEDQVKAERSGYRYFSSIFTGNSKGLTVTVTPFEYLREDQ